jgi:hypothetical protein
MSHAAHHEHVSTRADTAASDQIARLRLRGFCSLILIPTRDTVIQNGWKFSAMLPNPESVPLLPLNNT